MYKIELNLTEVERDVILKALEGFSSDLNMEIADTDQMDYRDNLKHNRIIIHKVISILKEAKET